MSRPAARIPVSASPAATQAASWIRCTMAGTSRGRAGSPPPPSSAVLIRRSPRAVAPVEHLDVSTDRVGEVADRQGVVAPDWSAQPSTAGPADRRPCRAPAGRRRPAPPPWSTHGRWRPPGPGRHRAPWSAACPISQKPVDVAEPGQRQHLGVLPVSQQMRGQLVGPIVIDGRLQMRAGPAPDPPARTPRAPADSSPARPARPRPVCSPRVAARRRTARHGRSPRAPARRTPTTTTRAEPVRSRCPSASSIASSCTADSRDDA